MKKAEREIGLVIARVDMWRLIQMPKGGFIVEQLKEDAAGGDSWIRTSQIYAESSMGMLLGSILERVPE